MEAVPSRRKIASIIVTFVGIVALAVAGVSSLAGGQAVTPPGACPAGFEKALESAPGDGKFTTFEHQGVTISTADGFTASFSSPVANVAGFSVGGASSRTTENYNPPVASGAVTAPLTPSPDPQQGAISNICIMFGVAPTTTTTAGPTTTTAAPTSTTAEVSPTTVVATEEPTTTTGAEVGGVTVVPEEEAPQAAPEETPRAAPEELAFTGVGNSTALFAALGVVLISFGIGLAWAGRRETAWVHDDR